MASSFPTLEEEDGLCRDSSASREHNTNLLVLPVGRQGQSDAQRSDIQRFYSGASVLVTGATGFMGKVLIEKLLRSCPDIDSVYMIVREKKGQSLEERIAELVRSPCFDRIKRERPGFRSQLRAVAGDIGLEGLGLSYSDRHLLQQQVTIVFHVAATVRFDEHLKYAILQNVRGTKDLLGLCRTISKLKAVVHVSTAYSNCPRKHIVEGFYEPHLPSDHVISLAETHDVTTLDRLSHKLIGDWPNTYSYTKALSEDIVRNHGQGLPVVVFKPAIVISTKSEPVSGWIDNMYGPNGVMAGVGAGVLRTMHGVGTEEANIVPCDMVINALIASAWDVVENRTSSDVPVYNYVSPTDNPITWSELSRSYHLNGPDHPPSRAIWYWTLSIISNRLMYVVIRFFIHIVPAMLMDLFLLATNKKPKMMQMYTKIHKFLDVIAYFTTNHWKFEDGNVVDLWKKLGRQDQDIFFFDMRALNWDEYVRESLIGLRSYLLKDTPDTLPAAKIRFQRLYILHRFTQCLFAGLAIWLSLVSLSAIFSSY